MKRRVLRFLPPVLGVIVLGGIVIGLHGALRRVSLGDVLRAFAATPQHEVFHALMLLGLSVFIMAIYDIPGVLFARKLISFPKLGLARIALASSSAYALSHVLGAPAISAAAIRLRLYAQWVVPSAGIARIIALSGSMFSLGMLTLLGFILLRHPTDLPLFGQAVAPLVLRAAGFVLVMLVGLYVFVAQRRPKLTIFGRDVALPGQAIALFQVILSCADNATACAILYVVLPDTPGLTYFHLLGIYIAAFAGGLSSGLPGGVGVFDSVLLLGLADAMPPVTALGAILLFRVVYFIAPACIAALCYTGHEVWITAKGQDKGAGD
ncbi:MAG: hypothetical protein POH28_02555 [Acidocella sp.]|nr:hypothetical protein [Acidocella sp.]